MLEQQNNTLEALKTVERALQMCCLTRKGSGVEGLSGDCTCILSSVHFCPASAVAVHWPVVEMRCTREERLEALLLQARLLARKTWRKKEERCAADRHNHRPCQCSQCMGHRAAAETLRAASEEFKCLLGDDLKCEESFCRESSAADEDLRHERHLRTAHFGCPDTFASAIRLTAARLQLLRKNYAAALKQLRQVSKKCEHFPEALLLLAEIYLRIQKKPHSALSCLLQLERQKFPLNAGAAAFAGDLLFALRRPRRAAAFFAAAAALMPSNRGLLLKRGKTWTSGPSQAVAVPR